MSAERPHGALDGGFLGHLVARLQPRASRIAMPTLERRRPGIFEPRGPAPAATRDFTETTVAPDASPFTGAPSPVHPPAHASRGSAIGTPSPSPQIPVAAKTARSTAAQASVTTASRIAHTDARAPALEIPPKLQADASPVAARSPRSTPARETPPLRAASHAPPVPDSTPSQASRLPAISSPQAIAVRSAQIVPVEQSRLESRTTVVEREVDKHRDAPASVAPVPMLRTPPRLAHGETFNAPVAHPVRSAAMLATPAPLAPAPVQVSIGRVEIRGFSNAQAPASTKPAAPNPRLGLDEYLQQRHGNGR